MLETGPILTRFICFLEGMKDRVRLDIDYILHQVFEAASYDFGTNDESYVVADELVYGGGALNEQAIREDEQIIFFNGVIDSVNELIGQIRQLRGYRLGEGEDWSEFRYHYGHYKPGMLLVVRRE